MNSVVHFDIPAKDPKKSGEFYSHLFGWKIEPVPNMKYWMAYTTETDEQQRPKNPGAINGGIGDAAASPYHSPIIYIDVEDIDGMLKEIVSHGGKIKVAKSAMGEWGAWAMFEDPDGNVIGLYQR